MKSAVLTIKPLEKVILPFSYQHTLQGLVYELLSFAPEFSESLHNMRGPTTDAMKLFCFSRLKGKAAKEGKSLIFSSPFRFEIRSVNSKVADTIKKRVSENPLITIDGFKCRITEVKIISRTFTESEMDFHVSFLYSIWDSPTDLPLSSAV